MSILRIRLFGDPVLARRSAPVTAFDADLARFGDDLTETMHDADGVGLAAPQVGTLKRMFAYDLGEDAETGEHPHGVLVNPRITHTDGEQTGEEGCLSLPGLYYDCTRALAVRVAAQDVTGARVDLAGEGLLARVFQHEIDHLDGVVFLDRLPRATRKLALAAWREREQRRLEHPDDPDHPDHPEHPGGAPPHLHRSDLLTP